MAVANIADYHGDCDEATCAYIILQATGVTPAQESWIAIVHQETNQVVRITPSDPAIYVSPPGMRSRVLAHPLEAAPGHVHDPLTDTFIDPATLP
jgi:hypothetical protein